MGKMLHNKVNKNTLSIYKVDENNQISPIIYVTTIIDNQNSCINCAYVSLKLCNGTWKAPPASIWHSPGCFSLYVHEVCVPEVHGV